MAVYSNTGDVLQYAQNQQKMSRESFANTMAMIMNLLKMKQDQGQFDTSMTARGDSAAQDMAWEREKYAGEAPVRAAQIDRDKAYTKNLLTPDAPKQTAMETKKAILDSALERGDITPEQYNKVLYGIAPEKAPAPSKSVVPKVPTKSALQARLELIDVDTNLTPEEKVAARKAALGVKPPAVAKTVATKIGAGATIDSYLNPPERKKTWADMQGMMKGGGGQSMLAGVDPAFIAEAAKKGVIDPAIILEKWNKFKGIK
jgi:hypothetical protein